MTARNTVASRRMAKRTATPRTRIVRALLRGIATPCRSGGKHRMTATWISASANAGSGEHAWCPLPDIPR